MSNRRGLVSICIAACYGADWRVPLGIVIIDRVSKFKVIEHIFWIEKVSNTGFSLRVEIDSLSGIACLKLVSTIGTCEVHDIVRLLHPKDMKRDIVHLTWKEADIANSLAFKMLVDLSPSMYLGQYCLFLNEFS